MQELKAGERRRDSWVLFLFFGKRERRFVKKFVVTNPILKDMVVVENNVCNLCLT